MTALDGLNRILNGESLGRADAAAFMAELTAPDTPVERVAAGLIALRAKPETAEEIAGFVDCLRARAVAVPIAPELAARAMDVCGTGGDGSGTFNISTTVAFVLAAAGQVVAKHGNRSVSSRSGSFDVLAALRLPVLDDPRAVAPALAEHGLAFLYAPAFHPALRQLATLRRNLGVYTVLNALGPLLNPIAVGRQLIGVYRPELLEKLAHVLLAQGAAEAFVVRSDDGMDELSLNADSRVAHLRDGRVTLRTIRAADHGLPCAPDGALQGGDAVENARILVAILRGETGARRDIVVLNAGAALQVGGRAADLREGIQRAQAAIDSGAALTLLKRMGAEV